MTSKPRTNEPQPEKDNDHNQGKDVERGECSGSDRGTGASGQASTVRNCTGSVGKVETKVTRIT